MSLLTEYFQFLNKNQFIKEYNRFENRTKSLQITYRNINQLSPPNLSMSEEMINQILTSMGFIRDRNRYILWKNHQYGIDLTLYMTEILPSLVYDPNDYNEVRAQEHFQSVYKQVVMRFCASAFPPPTTSMLDYEQYMSGNIAGPSNLQQPSVPHRVGAGGSSRSVFPSFRPTHSPPPYDSLPAYDAPPAYESPPGYSPAEHSVPSNTGGRGKGSKHRKSRGRK
ncbi:hypothetical protein [Xenorhabdus bharatensis]|uniref:hypothetical protein n=1 Tax=Xenorhabdus bharatensis TaxID=3136256 RepID=UPI0030F400C9